ncbi:MAG: TonB-dependent receptor [Flavobacteriaceae bacterium]|nr:TonB-dependent receptor [Flavobacteriaceae bacterium]
MRNHSLFILFLFSVQIFSQTTISGKVTDPKGIPIPGANVFIEGTYDGTTSSEDGTFSFSTLSTGVQTLQVSYLSFETYKISKEVTDMNLLNIRLRESVDALDAVVLSAGTFEAGDKARVSVLKPLDIVTTAGSAGDIVGALQTLPGVQTVGESGRLFVRGGEADETQTFIDGIRVAQPYGASVQNLPTRGRFSPFLFSGISFSTGGYSAEYGEALSSVLLLNTKDEAEQNQTELSLMTVGLGVGHSLKRESSSFTINTAYINLEPYQALVSQDLNWNKAFESISGEAVYVNRFEKGLLKSYAAFDASSFDFNQENINNPTPQRIDLKNNNFYTNTSYKSYWNNNWQFYNGLSYGFGTNTIFIDSDKVQNDEHALHLKSKVSRRFSNRIKLDVGADFFSTHFDEDFRNTTGAFDSGFSSNSLALYAEGDFFFSKKLAAKVGVRGSQQFLLDETRVSPRVSVAYKFGEHAQFALAYGRFSQTPKQDYLKYNTGIDSENATHYILNYQFDKNGRTLRLEGYYKDYKDLIRFDEALPQFDSQFNNNGIGYAAGLDFFWRDNKTIKNLQYWVSYSFIDTERLYRNFPKQATPSFVAQHTASLVTKYWVENWRSQLGFSHTFHTGRPFNNPNEATFMNGNTKAYNSLAFNWAYLVSHQKILYFSVSNVLGTQNVFGYEYANTPNANGTFDRRAITPTADRFFFVGFFWTISDDKQSNQLENL